MRKRVMSILSCILLAAQPVLCSAEGGTGAIADAIAQETSSNYVMDASIPISYTTACEHTGTLEEIHYGTSDYFGDGSAYTKRAYVYLPYGYSTDKQYRVLILCHGIGGSEKEWGLTEKYSKVRMMMDRLIDNGEIEPFIVVTPNGKAGDLSKPGIDPNDAYRAFYLFGQELRNDLLPYLDAHYSTYGSGKDLTEAREYRAMAGLSMGAMQTINIGMCECLDLFSWFGAFSACPTTYSAAQIARKLDAFPDLPIRYFYSICGLQDNIAYQHAAAAAKEITACTDRLNERNWAWQEKSGAHDFSIWYLGFYNFARIFGAKQ